MTRKTRIILGLLILAVSLSLVIWGFFPSRRESHTFPIQPADLQLPTPASLLITPVVVS
ncbi:MAG: hypothetical protein QM730_20210 [Anaerolineales bacterium]